MQQKILRFIKFDTWSSLPAVLKELLKDEAIGGKLILLAALAALIIANTPFRSYYDDLWHQVLSITVAGHGVSLDLRHWVSEGLMALFFLVVGLEIKREAVKGQLRHFRTALLPIGAAIGGMVVPAILFIAISAGSPEVIRGWAIPTATDIAFALAVISLLGNRVPPALKLFLLTLAIVDDLGSIGVIALFYGSAIAPVPVMAATAIALSMVMLARYHRLPLWLFCLLGVVFWYAVLQSGIHASIAGAILGFLAPLSTKNGTSVAERLEAAIIPISTFIAVPLFAFVSLGIPLGKSAFDTPGATTLGWGIVGGFVLGKALGVSLTTWVLTKLKLSDLPKGVDWFQLLGVSFLAGIGFTVSVFIADVAFADNQALTNVAKISTLAASAFSAVSGYLFLRHRKKVATILGQDG